MSIESSTVHIPISPGAFLARLATVAVMAWRRVGTRRARHAYPGPVVDGDPPPRDAAEGALLAHKQFTDRLLEVSPTPIFVRDEHGRFITVNRAWQELTCLAQADVLGRHADDVFGSDGAKHVEGDSGLLASDERFNYETRLLLAGRLPRDVIVSKVRFTRADGSAAGILGSIVDVTAFRDAERDFRQARDAAHIANSAKSEFIANVSHELRTPLQGILGFSELGRDRSAEFPEFLDMFADIIASGQRMLTLVNGLLDVSQMDGAVGSLPLERVDVAPIVSGAVAELQGAALARKLKIRAEGLTDIVPGDVDRGRFQQAIRNVLSNAMRYSPDGSAIDVALVDRGATGIELTVRDRGTGVPEDELELIFDAFVQSSRTRDGSGGTGLGLTITRKIMSAHGGSIIAANALEGGTLISLCLPAAGVVANALNDLSWQDADGVLFASEDI